MSKETLRKDSSAAKPLTFRATILRTGKNTAGIQVPDRVLETLGGGKRPLIWVTIKRHTYRSAVGTMGGKPMIPLSAANRQAAGVEGGEQLDIGIRLDLEPRTVQPPKDPKAALVEANALEAFDKSAASMQKEYVRQVEEAKAPETRQRRIAKIVERLAPTSSSRGSKGS
jgi:hypothetical protein